MELYLLRHAIAVNRGTPGYPNDDRPLTKDGIEKMEQAAIGIAKFVRTVDVIVSSPLKRAKETAMIAAKAMRFQGKIIVTPLLHPEVSPQNVIAYLSKFKTKKKLLVVGHEPNISDLASTLLGSGYNIIEMKKSALCQIDITEVPPVKAGTLIFHFPPKALRAFAQTKK